MVNDVFDQVYLINLDRRPDRLHKSNLQLVEHGISYQRVSAFDGSKLDLEKDALFRGQFGCKYSHLNCLYDIRQNQYKSALILEDDCVFEDGFATRFTSFYQAVPADYSMMYLGGNVQLETYPVNDQCLECRGIATTHAYAVSLKFCEILDLNKMVNHPDPIDTIYRMLHMFTKCYIPTEPLINQSAGFSDIIMADTDYNFNYPKPCEM